MERSNGDEHFLTKIVFGDESTFPLHGRHKPAIHRYRSHENQHLLIANRAQHPQKLNVWAGILGDHTLDPFFIHGNLTGQTF